MASYIKDKEDEAKATANEKAQNIIALAIERMSQQETIRNHLPL